MAKVEIELDVAGVGRILTGGGVRGALHEIAEDAATRARASARVDSGHYRDSITVESDTWRRGPAQYAIERVVAHDERAMAEEAVTSNLKNALR